MEKFKVKVLSEFQETRLPIERKDEIVNRIDEELGTLQKEREDTVQEIERLSLQKEENRNVIERLTEERIELSGRIKEAEKILKELVGTR
jgi:chromosome segregation ATPase|tara:strand:- start:360 stop:629 length:270 start_codon:yes stop_codon:yes gene_type:complete